MVPFSLLVQPSPSPTAALPNVAYEARRHTFNEILGLRPFGSAFPISSHPKFPPHAFAGSLRMLKNSPLLRHSNEGHRAIDVFKKSSALKNPNFEMYRPFRANPISAMSQDAPPSSVPPEESKNKECESQNANEASLKEESFVSAVESESKPRLKPTELSSEVIAALKKIEELRKENEILQARLAGMESQLSASLKSNEKKLQAENPLLESPINLEIHSETPETLKTQPIVLPKIKEISWPAPGSDLPFWESIALNAESSEESPGGRHPRVLQADPNPIHVVHITAEMAPIAKVGGLGDVVTGLSRACIARGHKVEVILPFYSCIDSSSISNLSLLRTFGSYFKGEWPAVEAYQGTVAGIPVIFLKPENHFFQGGRIYGGSYNELEAYLFFSRASLEYLQITGAQPDIIHLHEWHTSAVSLLYWDMYHYLSLKKPRLVLTIHNMEHYGECRWEQLDLCGLDGQSYLDVDKAVDDRTIGHNPERLSLLKGGIIYSNAVSTVSPTYVQETLCSGWLSETLLKYRSKYFGLLNGIDTEIWNPSTDPFLPYPFGDMDLIGKRVCKHFVQKGLGLELEMVVQDGSDENEDSQLIPADPNHRIPLVVCITRLVPQKGIHLIRHAIFHTQQLGGQFVLLGSAPDPRVKSEFEGIAKEFEESKDVRLILTYSETLSHLLYAAADIVLVPSMFEPCGLTQMIGMRYGTIPVVRKTGGLADTVFDLDGDSNSGNQANGFVFEGIHEGALDGALDRALAFYKQRPDDWNELTMKVMKIDNSWNKSAGEYIELYNSVRVR